MHRCKSATRIVNPRHDGEEALNYMFSLVPCDSQLFLHTLSESVEGSGAVAEDALRNR